MPEAQNYARPDHQPEVLAQEANKRGVGLEVTLVVGGLLVTGVMVSAEAHLEALAEVVATASADSPVAGFVEAWRRDAAETRDSRADDDGLPPMYVHLRDAAVIIGTFWRELGPGAVVFRKCPAGASGGPDRAAPAPFGMRQRARTTYRSRSEAVGRVFMASWRVKDGEASRAPGSSP
jgi:hypothetical protein